MTVCFDCLAPLILKTVDHSIYLRKPTEAEFLNLNRKPNYHIMMLEIIGYQTLRSFFHGQEKEE